MKQFIIFASILFSFVAVSAFAGTQVLGFELGVSTLEQVSTRLSSKTKTVDAGINKWSQGPMLKTDGSSYAIEGLHSVLYIFDEHSKLMAVSFVMDKSRFDSIYQYISGKYKVQYKELPFVGNQFARFKAPDAVIEIDAPHMSFEMSVRYLRNDLLQMYNTKSAAESAAVKKKEAEKF